VLTSVLLLNISCLEIIFTAKFNLKVLSKFWEFGAFDGLKLTGLFL
jgi:hypothetical protein